MADVDPDGGVGLGLVAEQPFPDLVSLLGPPFDRRRSREREARPSTVRAHAETLRIEAPAAPAPDGSLSVLAVDDIDGAAARETPGVRVLTRSIAQHGVLQPLLVRREGARYHVIAGRRRLAAARAAGLAKVPCVVRQTTAGQPIHTAIASNADLQAPADQPAGPDPAVTHQLLAQLSAGLDRIERRSAAVPRFASPDPRLLEALTEELAAIQSAATLLVVDKGSMVQRVAVDLLRAQTWRAAWLLRASALVSGSRPAMIGPARSIGAILAAVADAFAPEARLGGIEVRAGTPRSNESLPMDEQVLICGVTGGVIATLGLLDAAKGAVIGLSATRDAENTVSIQISQDVVDVPEAARGRFFDSEWTERSGGWVAALGASVAKLCAERHGGQASLAVRAGVGTRLELQFLAGR